MPYPFEKVSRSERVVPPLFKDILVSVREEGLETQGEMQRHRRAFGRVSHVVILIINGLIWLLH